MDITDLRYDFNKGNSLMFLKRYGFNVPDFSIVKTPEEFFSRCNIGDRVSIRTYTVERNEFKCPHFPNVVMDDKLFSECVNLLDSKYCLIVSSPIDPGKALFRGNTFIESVEPDIFLIEYSKGPGTVRDLESKGYKEIDTICSSKIMVYDELGVKGVGMVSECLAVFWGEPIIFEWSIYSDKVGVLGDNLIFWEVRKG